LPDAKPLIILVQPLTNIFDSGKSSPTQPLSLLNAVCRVVDRYRIRLLDLRRGGDWRVELNALLRENPLCVGTTSITGNQLFSALDISRFVRANSDAPMVWGGIHATLYSDQIMAEPTIDYTVRGEGEITFDELCNVLAGGGDPQTVAGLSFRRDGKIVHNPERPFIDLETTPDVPYRLLPSPIFFRTGGRATLYLETSRGCFSRCAYCYNATYHHRKWRAQSAAKVLARLRALRAAYPELEHLSLVDDNYFGDLNRVHEIAAGLIDMGSPLTYQVQGAHIQVLSGMSDEDLLLLRQSGCERLDMGVESGSEKILETMNKKLDLTKVRELNRRLYRVGIQPWYNFMVGFPGETAADIQASSRLVTDLLGDNPQALVSPMYRLVPYPGTELFHRAVGMGFIAPTTLDGWRNFHAGNIPVPWQSSAQRKRMLKLYFLSIFIDAKLEVYDTNPLYRLLARLYRPIARWRWKKNFLAAMPELFLFNHFFDIS